METLEELYEIFYSIPDPGASDEHLIEAIDNWLLKKNLTREQIFNLLLDHKQKNYTGTNKNNYEYTSILGMFRYARIGTLFNYKSENDTKNSYEKYACILGLLYHYGIGTRINYRLAFEDYKISAESGDAFGQNQLGYCYHFGIGTTRDFKAGFEWIQRSAMNGHICGQRTLGYHYHSALGCPRNYRLAFYWYMKAHEGGNPRAAYSIATCYFEGNGTFLDYHRGFRWAMKSGRYLHHACSYYRNLPFRIPRVCYIPSAKIRFVSRDTLFGRGYIEMTVSARINLF